ncbi:MAG: pyrroline-5-carboxylate reductase [Elusimicrobia bacterium RIFOXYA12_FULL_57_11]|nr:MAG: pyrroline-5-carboxylate reductase [Elusimicrobia bacterium RIFOXYA12_FULL_57_11]
MKKRNNVKAGAAKVAVLGAGNIGSAIARGLAAAGNLRPQEIILTRRRAELLEELRGEHFSVGCDNRTAVKSAEIIILAVGPQQAEALVKEIRPVLRPGRHIVISIVSGVTTAQLKAWLGKNVSVVRAMSNTAIAIREAMTCLCAAPESRAALGRAKEVFDALGKTLVINEELMLSATALAGCGIAFFLRAIRAASQGGTQIGFHSREALVMAAQTARGAASLLLNRQGHPESEIDKVTTPRGCTIEGLNEMEHHGFSSAMITGIVTSNNKAARLFKDGK